MLGFGDIAIPGLLVSFCLSFDKVISMRQKHFPSYYVSSLFAYGGGLTIAFTMATMTNEPQPALVYLVPANLLMVLIVGWRRSELKDLWQGINMGMLEAVPVTREDNNPFQQEEIMTSDDEDVNFDKTKLIKTSTV
ncbi:signal peptide peptidase-like 2A [Corticium candelabrum]|uniref:signal peptide peptidase-like 2A n=1 Tax=Corticium candelabrum TaxID=121492 RepID=UPI002E2698D2|nr:signal peptide peptidase-like 2A [Corticium candelabrum]